MDDHDSTQPKARALRSATRFVYANPADGSADETVHHPDVDLLNVRLLPNARAEAARREVAECARRGNVVVFHKLEHDRPFYAFEQRRRCFYCGHDSFTFQNEDKCCGGGKFVHTDTYPDAAISLLTTPPGISASSRALNDMNRLCEQGFPKGTTRFVHESPPSVHF